MPLVSWSAKLVSSLLECSVGYVVGTIVLLHPPCEWKIEALKELLGLFVVVERRNEIIQRQLEDRFICRHEFVEFIRSLRCWCSGAPLILPHLIRNLNLRLPPS